MKNHKRVMKNEAYDSQKGLQVFNDNSAKQNPNILKIISWILAYAVWLFILLIPIIGIVLIIMFLLRNKSQQSQ